MRVTLASEGQVWLGWKSFSISKTLDKAQHSFTMSTTDRQQEGLDRWNVNGGSSVQIYFNDDLVFDGFVQKYNPSITASSHEISISGESKAIDAVQSSHTGEMFWKNKSADDIVKEVIEPFGLEVEIDESLGEIGEEGFRVAANDTPFSIVKRLAERNGRVVFTDRNGKFRVSSLKEAEVATTLTRGDWVEISAEHDVSKSFSEIIVKGQRNSYVGTFEDNQRTIFPTTNSSQKRFRPKIVLSTGTDDQQKRFSQYVHRRLSGDSVSATVKVKSAYNKEGVLWGVGDRVWLDEPLIDIDQEMVVSELTFDLNDQGFSTTLKLKVPETYTIDPAAARPARKSIGFFGDLLRAFL